MPLTLTEHYVVACGYFMGGILSVVSHLWLLFDFFPQIKMSNAQRAVHKQLSIANLFVVLFFFIGAVSHFEQGWVFGPAICKFYIFWCKLAPIAAVGILAACLSTEYQLAVKSPSGGDVGYRSKLFLAWANGLFWGVGALTWAKYGQEPAGFTCTVIWYQVQPYVTMMTAAGFGLPIMIASYYAYALYSRNLLANKPLAKSAVALLFTMVIQMSGYAIGYVLVLLGWELSLYALIFAQIWTKVFGIAHPFVYSNMLADKEKLVKKE